MPFDIEMFLVYLISDLDVSHFHGVRTMFFDSVICNACGCFSVSVYGGGRLQLSDFFKDEPEDLSFFGIHE